MRAAVELATSDGPVKGEHISQSQDIPLKFLENILIEMRHAGLVRSQRGREGGYWLAREPDDITIADVASGSLPREIVKLAKDPDAWAAR